MDGKLTDREKLIEAMMLLEIVGGIVDKEAGENRDQETLTCESMMWSAHNLIQSVALGTGIDDLVMELLAKVKSDFYISQARDSIQ